MVTASTRALVAIALALAAPASTSPTVPSPTTAEPAAKALAHGEYPWYDAKADALKAVKPPAPTAEPAKLPLVVQGDASLLGWIGQGLVFTLIALGLAALVGVLAWALNRGKFDTDPSAGKTSGPSRKTTRVADLPAGLATGSGDPLAEAARLRAAGDYAGAILCLFAHQLLTLDRLRLVRLMPGRTGRQLVRSVANTGIRDLVTPTLRLFEEVYYGHDRPSAESFEAVWEQGQALEKLVARGPLT